MYIKSMVLEGFKSYAKRTEINGFDKQFNAITGFNGSGKSNILDAICFVLGITSLQKVRATSLQDLVYKSGQAGVKKASVTITFDNRNKSSSPLGYEHFDEIIVTRQVVVGGKNKYMINGTNAQNKKVHDMFCSIQLNINNPHFLIMQGTITKVLNMKPREILSMLEEAAGTSMYETKKQEALKLIEKKEAKLKEIKSIIIDELEPKLARLKEERFQMAEYQRVERELAQCKKIYIAFQYVKLLSDSEEAEKQVNSVKKKMEKEKRLIETGKEEIQNIEQQLEELAKKRDSEEGGKLESLSQELQAFEKQEHKLVAELNGKTETLETAKKDLKQLQKSLADDEKALAAKLKELDKLGGLFERLKERDRLDSEAVAKAQERFQKISMGLLESDTGENATLEQQLINAKQSAMQAQTELQQCEMEISHKKEQLAKKQSSLKNTQNESKEDNKLLENKQKELKTLTNEMNKLNYTEGTLEQLEQNRLNLVREIRSLQEKIHQFESRYPQLRFNYRDPDANFNRKSVKGLVCTLFSLKEEGSAYALELAAGGRLYNVVVDNEETSKKLLNRGQLQQRVTIIPLNKISGRSIEPRVVKLAQDLAGKENVQPALSLIDFPEELRPAMTWVFGQIFICKDMQSARTVAFHNNIRKKCVTISGDVFDPAGTLSGGAAAKGGSVLLQLNELKVMQAELASKEDTLKKVEAEIARVGKSAEQFATLKRRYDISNHEIAMVNQRLQQTTYHKMKEEIEELQKSLEELQNRMKVAKEQHVENSKRAKQLESQLSNAAKIGEMQLKDAEEQLNKLQKKADQSKKEWQKHEQESDRLDLEVKELRKFIDNGKEEITKAEENIASDTEKIAALKGELQEKKERISDLVANLKMQKDLINQQNKDMQKLTDRKDKIHAQSQHAELEIKKLSHEIEAIESNASDCRKKVATLTRQHDWIEQEKSYFGKAGGMFDFTINKPEEIAQKVQRLESSFAKLSRNINMRALTTMTKEEEQHKEILKRKHIVENDKAKILDTIKSLDAKKEQTLISAWEEVNKNFGSIFTSLLPGAKAKLQPLENKTVLEGLEVKVGFSGVWKESLGELSGGQRSLVALSLILSMLLFKPAPLYILDEVDAALDLSHTENIGTMLKAHFKHSQFIIVSLKDGMFNNANVLFTTRFVDGMSTINRVEKSRSA